MLNENLMMSDNLYPETDVSLTFKVEGVWVILNRTSE